jgi:hypothetical protein
MDCATAVGERRKMALTNAVSRSFPKRKVREVRSFLLLFFAEAFRVESFWIRVVFRVMMEP